NRDGAFENWSHGWGAEGETSAPEVLRARQRAARSLLATLAFSQGVPMLGHGDELGRTQRGNNNAYCQDGELSWIDWELGGRERELLAFARRVFLLRRTNPVFRRRHGFSGAPSGERGAKDVTWLRPDGAELRPADWQDPARGALGMLIHGRSSDEVDAR